MMGCRKCMLIGGLGFLVAGILFLLRDLGWWNFWNIQWWTVLFIWMGIGSLAQRNCPDCQAMMGMKKK